MTPSDTNKTDNTEIDSVLSTLYHSYNGANGYGLPMEEAKAALETLITQRCKESYKKGYIAAGIDGLKNE